MDNYNVQMDSKMSSLFNLMTYNNKKYKIKENSENLYKITQEYLLAMGANPIFLDKPSVIERVKNIIFNNLLLSSKTKLNLNGIIEKDDKENILQKLAILENGSILFYSNIKGKQKAISFDDLDGEICCRFFEYGKDGDLKFEKRVIIGEHGFDLEAFEISNDIIEFDINEKYRESFKNIISHIKNNKLTAFVDWGNHSLTPQLDNEFICSAKGEIISKEELFEENKIGSLEFKDSQEICRAYPEKFEIRNSYDIQKIKENFNYYKDKYPTSQKWFIDRFGKQFLIKNNIISEENEIPEITLLDKIKLATMDEVLINFQDIEIETENSKEFVEILYDDKKYEKAMAFFENLQDKEKIEFIEHHLNYSNSFIATCVSCLDSDDLKIQIFDSKKDEFDIFDKVGIISSLKDEEEKVELYNEYLEDIIEQDNTIIEGEEENDSSSIYNFLSETVLDSLKEKDNIMDFILKFGDFPIIKYENIKDFSKDDIEYLIEDLKDCLDTDEYIALLKTNKLDDDDIIEILENNWEEGLELSGNDTIEFQEDLSYTFKVFALLKVKDNQKRNQFLDDNIEYFDPDEISIILENLEDNEEMLYLAKKYNLPEDYYYYMITLCDDEIKFNCLRNNENLDLENFTRVVASIFDVSKAFDYIVGLDKMDIVSKMAVINELDLELCEESKEIYEKKFQFLKDNKDLIINSVNSQEDFEVFNVFATDFWSDYEKMEELDNDFKALIDEEEAK